MNSLYASSKVTGRTIGANPNAVRKGSFFSASRGERVASPPKPRASAPPKAMGLPHSVKSGIEAVSGMAMDNVKVHRNSPLPGEIDALAYAQGTHIHLAPGQEKHLPHEAWHLVQQAQGRVEPTRRMKNGSRINTDASLEHEADVMGAHALTAPASHGSAKTPLPQPGATAPPIQAMLRSLRTGKTALNLFSNRLQLSSLSPLSSLSSSPQFHHFSSSSSTPDWKQKLKQLENYNKKRYPVIPGHHDPLLRDHMIGNMSKILKEAPPEEVAKAKEARKEAPEEKKEEKKQAEASDPVSKTILAAKMFQQRQDKRIRDRANPQVTSPVALKLIEHAETVGFGQKTGESFEQMLPRTLFAHGYDQGLEEMMGSSTRKNKNVQEALGLKQKGKTPSAPDPLKKYFPQYFQGPKASLGLHIKLQQESKALVAQHFSTPDNLREAQRFAKDPRLEKRVLKLRQMLADKKKT